MSVDIQGSTRSHPDGFDPVHEHTRQRRDDHDTSRAGARAVTKQAPNLRVALLREFLAAGPDGLTDEEAAERAGVLDTCYWKRCNELRQDVWIMPTDRTRKGRKGVKRTVSVITSVGRLIAEHAEEE